MEGLPFAISKIPKGKEGCRCGFPLPVLRLDKYRAILPKLDPTEPCVIDRSFRAYAKRQHVALDVACKCDAVRRMLIPRFRGRRAIHEETACKSVSIHVGNHEHNLPSSTA